MARASAPDMAISKFLDAVDAGRTIAMFGDGSSRRDYTYVDDIVSGVVAAIERVEQGRYELYNLGGTQTIGLRELIGVIERTVGKPAVIDQQPDQPGDVPITYANIDRLARRWATPRPPASRPASRASGSWRQGRPIP